MSVPRYLREWLIGVLLVGGTVVVFWPACHYGFVNYDDDVYGTANPHVRLGLTPENVRWAWTSEVGFWEPLTWMSLQLDAEIYRGEPAGFHVTNLLLHLANTVLLFIVLRWMTGATDRSAWVAAFFAMHPLAVEPAVWVAERKGVLSSLFWMLALLAYAWYVSRPGWKRYLLVLAPWALGMMAKPMLVTLPAVLLLLDYWPLERVPRLGASADAPPIKHRFPRATWRQAFLEKLPFLFLALGFSAVAVHAEQHVGALDWLPVSPAARLGNAVVSYLRYIRKLFWPTDLAPFYPHLGNQLPGWQVGAAALALTALTVGALALSRRWAYVGVGWLWYLGTLVPVIGLVQVGRHGMADRYAYIPLIGLYLVVVWGVADLAARWSLSELAGAVGGLLLLGCIGASWLQVHYWQDNLALWKHTVEVDPRNPVAHDSLGVGLAAQGDTRAAIAHLREAVRLDPGYDTARYNLGVALGKEGRLREAVRELREAVRLRPQNSEFHYNLGVALAGLRHTDEAIAQFKETLRLQPDDTRALSNLALALGQQGRREDALQPLEQAVRLHPDDREAHMQLARMLGALGRWKEALPHAQSAIREAPPSADALYLLGRVQGRLGDWSVAVNSFRRAVDLEPQAIQYRTALAAAWGQAGDAVRSRQEYEEIERLEPQWKEACRETAWRLATDPDPGYRDGALAQELAQQVCEAPGTADAKALDALAAADAELGDFEQAQRTAEAAIQRAAGAGNANLARAIQERQHLYQKREAFRDRTRQGQEGNVAAEAR